MINEMTLRNDLRDIFRGFKYDTLLDAFQIDLIVRRPINVLQYDDLAWIETKKDKTDPIVMLSQLILTFLGYVFIAFVIAVPIIWYIMNRWLSDYSYRISLSPWIFITAGAFCLLVSFVSVYWQVAGRHMLIRLSR